MGSDLIKVAEQTDRRLGGVQELSSLDAVILLRNNARERENRAAAQRAASHTQVQPSKLVKRIEQHLTVVAPRLPQTQVEAPVIPPLPAVHTGRSYGIYLWFAACVLLPTLIASIYYGFIASNQYVAEFRFSVRNASTPGIQSISSFASLLGGGDANSATDNYMVTDFLRSREAVDELQKRINVKALYSSPDIDWWSRFDKTEPTEQFVDYWKGMVSAEYDMVSGIASAQVRAFTPQDALLIANTLVAMSEQLVNKIANRSQRDAVRFAKLEVKQAQDRLKDIRTKLAAYRNKFGIINPESSVVASNSSLIQTQRANLAQLETQLATLQARHLAPNAPAIVALQSEIKSTRQQLARTEADVGRNSDGLALSTVVGKYEQLQLELQFAQSMVTSTMQALDNARANAAAQHLYITPYIRPSLPQSSIYPRRFLSTLIVAGYAFAIWLIGLMVVRSIRERFG